MIENFSSIPANSFGIDNFVSSKTYCFSYRTQINKHTNNQMWMGGLGWRGRGDEPHGFNLLVVQKEKVNVYSEKEILQVLECFQISKICSNGADQPIWRQVSVNK